MHDIIALLSERQQAWDREKSNLITTKEKAIMDLYKIRNYIDDQIKKKVPFDTILVEVHKQLKALTPHGPNMTCDA
jgi:hypothetical protein